MEKHLSGIVTDFYGHKPRYDHPTKGIVVANNKTIHAKLIRLIRR